MESHAVRRAAMAQSKEKAPAGGITPVRVIVPVFIAFAVLLVMMWYGMSHNRELIDYADFTVEQMTESAASEIGVTVNFARSSIRGVSVSLAARMDSDNLDNPAVAIAPLANNTPFGTIEYIRADGMNVMNIGEPFDASDRVYYIQGIRGASGIWANYHPKTSQETLLNFYTPIVRNHRNVGVLTGCILADTQLAPMLETTFFGEPTYGILFDSAGMIIATTIDCEYEPDLSIDAFLQRYDVTDAQRDEMRALLSRETDGAVTYHGPDGTGRICVTAIPGTDWYAAQIIPGSSFQAVTGRSMEKTMATILLIFLLLAAYLVFVMLCHRREKNLFRRQAEHDALTGLYNRGSFETMMQKIESTGESYALCLIDIDDFKRVNDTAGHAAGDAVLRRTASILLSSFRGEDVICRIGGDEFAVIARELRPELRNSIERKFKTVSAELAMPTDDTPAVTISTGIAFSTRESDSRSIFNDADTALYRVKQNGKNGVAFY